MERTYAFVDLAGFSALTEAHGDPAAADLVERFTDLVDQTLAGDAQRVRTIGDAVFLVALEPSAALRTLDRLWAKADASDSFPVLRAGLHHGEAVQRGSDYFGNAVNIAARVTALAAGGQVLATNQIAEIARSGGRAVTAFGKVELKNLRNQMELYAIDFRSSHHPAQEVDPVCRMRVNPETAAAHVRHGDADHYFCSPDCARTFLASLSPSSSS